MKNQIKKEFIKNLFCLKAKIKTDANQPKLWSNFFQSKVKRTAPKPNEPTIAAKQ